MEQGVFFQNNLVEVIIPNNVKELDKLIFSDNQLKEVIILENVEIIGDRACIWGWADGYNDENIEWN